MKKKVLLFLKIVFTILLIISIVGLLSWFNDNRKIKKINDRIDDYLDIDEDGYKLKTDLNHLNKDTVGWIIVKGTNINYPIVQGKDNNYYLNHDYYKDLNSAGWLFMDSNNKLDDQNIVIYGHHRQDGIMFGDIDKLFKKKYYDNNDGKILLIVNDQEIYYQIFSVYEASSDDYYNSSNFKDFKKAIKEFEKRSEIDFDEKLDNVEQILTLSTCHNNNRDRLVVQAYRIN